MVVAMKASQKMRKRHKTNKIVEVSQAVDLDFKMQKPMRISNNSGMNNLRPSFYWIFKMASKDDNKDLHNLYSNRQSII